MKTDSWKWPIVNAEEPLPDQRYAQQLELQLNKTVDATPEQVKEWQEKELNWWGERQLSFVAIASLIQLSALGFMLTCFFLISKAFSA